MTYAYDTQKRYADWLSARLNFNFYSGIAEIALAGPALGLAATGGSAAAAAALGTAAGATVALDQWAVGSPPKDPRMTIVMTGLTELQCVITDARGALPKSVSLPNPPPPDVAAASAAYLKTLEDRVLSDIGAMQSAGDCPGGDDTQAKALRLALAEGNAAVQRSQAIRNALLGLPGNITATVRAIHWSVYTQEIAAMPDITTVKVTPLSTKTAPAPAMTPSHGNFAAVLQQKRLVCLAQLPTLTADTGKLGAAIAGVKLPQPGFAECIQATPAPKPSPDPTGGSPPPAPNKPAAPAPLALQTSPTVYTPAGETQKIVISGGNSPIIVVPVDPGLTTPVQKPASSGTVEIDVGLQPQPPAPTARLLVTDVTGAELIVTLQQVTVKK